MSVSSPAREPFDVGASRGSEVVTIRRQAAPNWKALVAAGAGVALLIFVVSQMWSGPSELPVENNGATSTSGTTSTTTVTTVWTPTKAKTADQLAAELNVLYKGFDPGVITSPLGVTLWFRDDWVMYCAPGEDNCYQGAADCRISASLFNNKVILTKDNQIAPTMQRKAGVIFNDTAVSGWLGKCSYIWDGTSLYRYNHGCGATSHSTECSDPSSAYGNECPSNPGVQCATDAVEVLRDYWRTRQEGEDCPHRTDDDPCYWKGVSFSTPHWNEESKAWEPTAVTKDETREMMNMRLERQILKDPMDPNDKLATHNEIVLDGAVLLQDLQTDPLRDIAGFFYIKDSTDPSATRVGHEMAVKIRETFRAQYAVLEEPPLIAIDTKCDVSYGYCPFLAGVDEQI